MQTIINIVKETPQPLMPQTRLEDGRTGTGGKGQQHEKSVNTPGKIAPLNIGSLFNKFKAGLEGEKH